MATKLAYLTIDDAPSHDSRSKLDYLIEKNIPAVLFCLGQALEEFKHEALYAIENGFIIGNHSYSHPYFSEISLTECYDEIKHTENIIEALYKQSEKARPAKYFRFPYGDKGDFQFGEVCEPYVDKVRPKLKKKLLKAFIKNFKFSKSFSTIGIERKAGIQEILEKLGYVQPHFPSINYQYYQKAELQNDIDWHWTYNAMEWAVNQQIPTDGINSVEKVMKRMDEDDPENGKGLNYLGSNEIILLHDHSDTSYFFKQIIDKLLDKGLRFKSPLELSHNS